MGLLFVAVALQSWKTLLIRYSALGTPLEWPQAKQAADQVREWGIEVTESPRLKSTNR